MPTTTRDVPREAAHLPASAKKIWMAAFKGALKEKPENIAADLAMAAVKKKFKRRENEKGEEEWISAKKAEEEERAAAIAAGEDPEAMEGEGDPEAAEGEGDPGASSSDPVERARAKVKAKAKAAPAEEEEEDPEETKRKSKKRKINVSISEATDSVQITETFSLDSAGFRLTGDGYLVANPRVARTGIQIYKGWEVGRPDMDDVRVYRPETEVFSIPAMASLAHRPITLDHPQTKVDATNWRKLAVGKSDGEVARDGDFLRVPLVLMDQAAINDVQAGQSQVSVGYGAKLLWQAGHAPDGQFYDAVQTEIRANHIAMVTNARGGPKLKIGDGRRNAQQRRNPMSERTMTIDGVAIELEGKDAQILQRHLDGLERKLRAADEEINSLEKKIEEAAEEVAEAKKDSSTKDGQIAALTQKIDDAKLTPEQIHRRIEATMDVVDRATTFFGDDKYAWRGKTDVQMKREVVASRMGDQRAKAMNDDAIEGAFLSITEPETQDGITRTVQSFSRAPANTGINDRAAKAYDKRNEELNNKWKKNRKPFGATA